MNTNTEKDFITDNDLIEELLRDDLAKKIVHVTANFTGQLDDLYSAIGLIVVGRLLGWRVVRLVAPRRLWVVTNKLFGDPKKLMQERGYLYYKSIGCKIVDDIGGYWDFISGAKSRDSLPMEERKKVL